MITEHGMTPAGETLVSPVLYIRQYTDALLPARARLNQGLAVKQQCRALANVALQRACANPSVRLNHTRYGQPFGDQGQEKPAQPVSTSHSQNWYAVATAPAPLGIDIQVYRRFSVSNQQRLFDHNAVSADTITQTAQWSLCEAYLKSHGRGLPFDLRTIRIQQHASLGATSCGRITSKNNTLTPASYWLWQTLYFCCAVCIAGHQEIVPTLSIHTMENNHDTHCI
ncbi:4'-phosphopantetheinyl transferase family protein [Pseudoalteromonas ardens]|uniref:4'-phosphopantetheinyl transferase family protein n=1 Tax=Pseudoalteromonas ardens TaxID=3048490 RepID=UPI000675D04E|nr:4'-phosphopantetheinyl transferase superfamily protein [Pseudoalteromonas sp. R96]MDK1311621.1 4'-phosphopantetheinyl transferase superfamily protein [Pseudoalteromonas sp. R96]